MKLKRKAPRWGMLVRRSVKNTKRKGNRNERRTMALLETAGYRCSRSAASLGDWDVFGIGTTDFVVVQVKTNRLPRPEEMETLKNFQAPTNCKKLVHVWYDHKHKPRVVEL